MEDVYELREPDKIQTILNYVRPISLSDSYTYSNINKYRVNYEPFLTNAYDDNSNQTEETNKTEETLEIIKETEGTWTTEKITNSIVKFIFHIALISVFETVFFFKYVSTLESSGLNKTVSVFIDGIVDNCRNMTVFEEEIINTIMGPYVNRTEIMNDAYNSLISRDTYNDTLMRQSWIYVGTLLGLFGMIVGVSIARQVRLRWKVILVDNIIMIVLLGLYEYMFFDTIIYNYKPITSIEIAGNAIQQIHNQCHIL